jgi:hypothetical protein
MRTLAEMEEDKGDNKSCFWSVSLVRRMRCSWFPEYGGRVLLLYDDEMICRYYWGENAFQDNCA